MHSLTPSIIEAWFKLSLIIASLLSNSGSNRPPFASNAAAYNIVSSVSKNLEILSSHSVCISWVPHINLTEASPKPWESRAFLAASIISGLEARPK